MPQETNPDKVDRVGRAPVFSMDHDDVIKIQKSLLHEDFEIGEAPGLPHGGTYLPCGGFLLNVPGENRARTAESPDHTAPLPSLDRSN